MSKDASINWMYEGAKSNVHREDYLLGKKVDRNFEKYSDVVNAQKAEVIDKIVTTRTVFDASSSSTGLKTSSLQKDIIKSEDPFVAVKVREETKRRELMENPLMKMRFQNMLKTMMTSKSEKKKDKKSKKDKKKTKKRSRSSSSSSRDSSTERPKKDAQKRRSSSPKRKRKTSEREEEARNSRRRDSNDSRTSRVKRRSRSRSVQKDTSKKSRSSRRVRSRSLEGNRRKSISPRRPRSGSRSKDRARRSSRSPKRHRLRSQEKSRQSPGRSRDDKRKLRRQSRSRSRSTSGPSSSQTMSFRQFDSHIPQHLQNPRKDSGSDSDPDHQRKRKYSGDAKEEPKAYGLVQMRKRTSEEREGDAEPPTKEYKLVKLPTGRESNNKKEPRRVLTDEERAARLAEMQENVKWRDDVRTKNVEKSRAEEEEEKEETDKSGYAPSFIRNQIRDACDGMTVEKRLQSRKGGIQRSHGYMDRSFAKKS